MKKKIAILIAFFLYMKKRTKSLIDFFAINNSFQLDDKDKNKIDTNSNNNNYTFNTNAKKKNDYNYFNPQFTFGQENIINSESKNIMW